jgi:hypothetical protein
MLKNVDYIFSRSVEAEDWKTKLTWYFKLILVKEVS